MIVKEILKRKKRIKQKYFAKSYNKEQIIIELNNFGINQGMSIFVHSSLSKLGNIVSGADTVVEALIETVGQDGSIMMPGFTIRKSMLNSLEFLQKNDITFDYKTEKPLVGAIPRSFFKLENIHRSIHPTHSVLAWGKNAEHITSGQENCNTTFGIGTPLYKLIETDSYIMGLGSDLAHVTFYHVLEDLSKPFPIDVYWDNEYKIKMLINKNVKIFSLKSHKEQKVRIEKINGTWVRTYFRKYFRKKGKLIEGKIGNANCWMIKAKDMYNCIEELMNCGITIYSPAPNNFIKLFYSMKGIIEQLKR
jgi:aminoglycoside 3-N-acetyltransferase